MTGWRIFTGCCWGILIGLRRVRCGILLSQFIYSLLSSRTKTETTYDVVRRLRERFGSWENLRDASAAEIETAIGPFAGVYSSRCVGLGFMADCECKSRCNGNDI